MTTQASMGNQTLNMKRPREGGFCQLFFWGVCFMVGAFFPFMFLSSLESFFYQQKSGYYLQIKHNRRCLPQSE